MAGLERELKLAAPASFRLPELDGLAPGVSVSAEEVQRQTSIYYDTADLRLTRWDRGLRFRSSDGWTLKLPTRDEGPALVRREVRFAGSARRPPAAAVDLLLAVTRGAELAPVVTLRTIRRRVDVLDGAGELLAEVTNDHVAVLDGGRVTQRFREVEVEFSDACPPEILESLVARLRRAGTGPAHRIAKHVRALGLESGVMPEVAVPQVWPGDSAHQVLRLALARSVSELVQRDAGVRIDEDLEDVHQMRVATRRLRSALRTFLPLFEESWGQGLASELRWIGDSLGRVRDADVLALRLRNAAAELEPADRRSAKDLLDRLAESRQRDLAALLEVLRSDRYLALVEELVRAARAPQVRPAAYEPAHRVLPGLVWRRWKRLARSVRRLGKRPTPEALHRVRIRAKRARYAADALIPVFGKPARRFARAARGLQQLLGEHQDAVVAAAWLRHTAEEVPREAAFVAGLLAAQEKRQAAETLSRWPRAWARAADRRRREWLRSALWVPEG